MRVYRRVIADLDQWDSRQTKTLLECLGFDVRSVSKGLKEGYLPELVIELNENDTSLLETLLDDVIYGGDVPGRDLSMFVKKPFEARAMSSQFAAPPVELIAGDELSYVDKLPFGDLVYKRLRKDDQTDALLVMSTDELATRRNSGELVDKTPGEESKLVTALKKKMSSNKAKAARSIFAKTGVFVRVSKDFPPFGPRPLMRTYLKMTSDQIADEMPPPVEPEGDGDGEDKPEPKPKPKPNPPSASSKSADEDEDEDDDEEEDADDDGEDDDEEDE